MVARTQGAQLVLAAVQGEVRHHLGVGAGDGAPGLDVGQVGGLAEAFFHRPAGPVLEHLLKCRAGELKILPPGTHPRGDVGEQGVHQGFHPGRHLLPAQSRAEQAHPAVDVVAHAAGGDDALFQVEGRHAADGEAVAPVDVGHGQGGSHDPRQGGDVGHLLEALVFLEHREHLLGAKDQPPGAHLALPGNLPAVLVDLPQLNHEVSGQLSVASRSVLPTS